MIPTNPQLKVSASIPAALKHHCAYEVDYRVVRVVARKAAAVDIGAREARHTLLALAGIPDCV